MKQTSVRPVLTLQAAAKKLLTAVVFLAAGHTGSAQGKVVINEYLAWPGNACAVTAEFIELLNFGPGPVNIGCYILTEGDYSITIPPNTWLQPGDFYVIAGQDVLPQDCGNVSKAVTTDLNWNTCNCTSAPIPTTGDGLMTDGGAGSEQLVLFNSNLKVVDAVVRQTPETSSPITTSTIGGQCTSYTFDLDTMSIQYETIGESQGRNNSFARTVDAGCTWMKDTQSSAGETNNTGGSSGDELNGSITVTNGQTCSNTGAAVLTVNNTNYTDIYPLEYTLAWDTDGSFSYDNTDTYSTGTDNTPNTTPFNNLEAGRYRLAVGTYQGCNMEVFDFVILGCSDVTLESGFLDFTPSTVQQSVVLQWTIASDVAVRSFDIERSADGLHFSTLAQSTAKASQRSFSYTDTNPLTYKGYYRIRLITTSGDYLYSPVRSISLSGQEQEGILLASPNPFSNTLQLSVFARFAGDATLQVADLQGRVVKTVRTRLQEGYNAVQFTTSELSPGFYTVQWLSDNNHSGHLIKVVKTP